jgi:hypothetical protein
MKSTSRRRLALKKLTVTKLAAARGGWHAYSLQAACSNSCNTCIPECGFEPDPTDLCTTQDARCAFIF